MSSIVGPTSPSSGGGGGGGNVVDTLQDTLGAGDRTGTASGILVDDGDLLAMASGAKITFSSNSNPGGLPDVIIQRSGIRTLAVNQPGGGGASLLANEVKSNSVIVGPGSASLCAVQIDNDSNTGWYGSANASLSAAINGTQRFAISSAASYTAGFIAMGSSIPGAHIALARSGVGLLGVYEVNTSAPASGHFGGVIIGPLSASGIKLTSDNNGRLLVQNGDGVAGDLTTNNLVVGGTITPLGHITQTNSRWRMQNTAQLDLVSGGRLGFSSSSTNATSQIDSAIVRSGVGSIALTNTLTSGPASLTVGDLTVLGTHNITGGGGGSSSTIYPTGLVIGAETASGTMLVSDLNGALMLRGGGGIGPGKIRLGPELIIGPSGNSNALAVSGVNGGADLSCKDIFARDVYTAVLRGQSAALGAGGATYYDSSFAISNNINYEAVKLNGDAGICWSADANFQPASFATASIGIATSGSYTKLALFNPETKAPTQLLLKNTACQIATSGSISGDLRIDMQGARVQSFSVSTTGLFTPYNLSYLSSEKQLFVTAVGTVGVTFDSSIKWLGSKPTTLGSGVTYMFSLMNYSPTQIVASYEALSDG